MQLVDNPIRTVWRSASAQFAAASIWAPELLEFASNNIDAMPLSPEWKTGLRIGLAALAIIARPVKQRSISG